MTLSLSCSAKFLPTPSARRATGVSPDRVADYAISTHALREEGDHCHVGGPHLVAISTHALREEGDARAAGDGRGQQISTHALREEGDQPGQLGK